MRSETSRIILAVAIGLLSTTATMLAQNCKAYPYSDGIDPEMMAQNKYVATAAVSVSFDDVDAVKDARDEATLEAKATLSKFFKEEIKSDQVIEKLVLESKTMSGDGKQNVRNETIRRTKSLRNHTEGLLKGVMQIGDCYTKGTEVRVTVGVKEESILAAEGMASRMNTPSSGSESKSGSNGKGVKQPLTGVDEVSNTKSLKTF
jgi:hypothetical protein